MCDAVKHCLLIYPSKDLQAYENNVKAMHRVNIKKAIQFRFRLAYILV